MHPQDFNKMPMTAVEECRRCGTFAAARESAARVAHADDPVEANPRHAEMGCEVFLLDPPFEVGALFSELPIAILRAQHKSSR